MKYDNIIWATISGCINSVKELIKAGADVFLQDKHGYTAVMWAARNGHIAIVKLLEISK